jgi:hypothetical protein
MVTQRMLTNDKIDFVLHPQLYLYIRSKMEASKGQYITMMVLSWSQFPCEKYLWTMRLYWQSNCLTLKRRWTETRGLFA